MPLKRPSYPAELKTKGLGVHCATKQRLRSWLCPLRCRSKPDCRTGSRRLGQVWPAYGIPSGKRPLWRPKSSHACAIGELVIDRDFLSQAFVTH